MAVGRQLPPFVHGRALVPIPRCTRCESWPYLNEDSQAPLGTIQPILVTSRGEGKSMTLLIRIKVIVGVTSFICHVGNSRSCAP